MVEFLQKVTYEHFCMLKWAAKFCRLILTTEIVESSSPAAIVDGDPQASEPSPAPATAADVKPGTDALSAAGDTLRKQWMGKEFTITLTKIQSGEVKMTVWALGQKCRREHHKRLQRLRSVYNIDKQGAAADSFQSQTASALRMNDPMERKVNEDGRRRDRSRRARRIRSGQSLG